MSVIEDLFGKEWTEFLGEDNIAEILGDISEKLLKERKERDVHPEPGNPYLFECFRLTSPGNLKLIIPGVEPYHSQDFTGLSFSSNTEEVPPSLETLIDEVQRTHGGTVNPTLIPWAKQGVLLFNMANSNIKGMAYEHITIWKPLTKLIIDKLNEKDNLVWLLLGRYITDIEAWITNKTHITIKYGYPSPLNEDNSIIGSNCFVQCDEKLAKFNNRIEWSDE